MQASSLDNRAAKEPIFVHVKGSGHVTIKAVVFDAYGTLFDIQSVASVTDAAFPGYGEIITQIWRLKQLEYTWLRSLMRRYEDFSVITRESLTYTLRTLGLAWDAGVFERIMDKYLHLDLYDDAAQTLAGLTGYRLAILSNGSTDMLTALVRNAGLHGVIEATISIDSKRIFKPSPEAYALVEERLGVAPAEVFFVSSNPWDAAGAKAFGFTSAWIERVTPRAIAEAFDRGDLVPPRTMFQALRSQMDELGAVPDHRVRGLSALAGPLGAQGA
jgi:2-haloacid dehalogenase